MIPYDDFDWSAETRLGGGANGIAYRVPLRGVPVCVKVGHPHCLTRN
jgi:hypothetical protein